MLVLKNGNGVMAEAGKPLGNNEVNALKIENTNAFSFGVVTTGPIGISWGDGTVLNLSTQTSRYNASKLYGSVGNWNIVVVNPENVKELYFDTAAGYGNTDRINTSVNWFLQFVNLDTLYYRATFSGDLATILAKLVKLTTLDFAFISTITSFNISNCKQFWGRCIKVYYYDDKFKSTGSLSDIDVNVNAKQFVFFTQTCNGSINGMLKNGYTVLEDFGIYVPLCTFTGFVNFQDWIIPPTLKQIRWFRTGTTYGIADNFNFNNLEYYSTEGFFTSMDFSNNQSFKFFLSRSTFKTHTMTYMGGTPIKFSLSDYIFNSPSFYKQLVVQTNDGYNSIYGDIGVLKGKLDILQIIGGKNNGTISGILDDEKLKTIALSYIDCQISADYIKLMGSKGCNMWFCGLPNATGDISGCTILYGGFENRISISSMPNLYCDITTLNISSWMSYTNNYRSLHLNNNPHFTGNLSNFGLWVNKQSIHLNNSSYTGIPGFIQKIFANRNSCLKATGGLTSISVQGNVDNALLTGTYQQPNLGTYPGNLNDLTEAQIDNLANGLDYTGTGTNTAWTDKEKIWFMVNCKNSSTDTSLRYRVTINY